MKCIFLAYVLLSVCQAYVSALPKKTPKDGSSTFQKIMSKMEKSQPWITLKHWYNKAHEFLLGEDGFFTTFYYSTGDAAKSKRKCCRCHRRTHNSGHHRSSCCYPYQRRNNYTTYYIVSDHNSGGMCCFGDSDANSASVPPPAGDGSQITATFGNGDGGAQVIASGSPDCCSNVDCSECAKCLTECLGECKECGAECGDCVKCCVQECICKPEVLFCCCLFQGDCSSCPT